MNYIKEPAGIDFLIKGRPLTASEDRAISEFIKVDRARLTTQRDMAKRKRLFQKVIIPSLINH